MAEVRQATISRCLFVTLLVGFFTHRLPTHGVDAIAAEPGETNDGNVVSLSLARLLVVVQTWTVAVGNSDEI